MLDDAQFRKLLDTRARHPERVAEAAKARRRRPVLNETGRLFLVAADHPARGIVKAGAQPLAMANRRAMLEAAITALAQPGVDGVLGSPDIIEDLLLLDALHDKIVIGSMNRGGLSGATWEIDDAFTGYDAESIEEMNLDGGKMLLRLVYDELKVSESNLQEFRKNKNYTDKDEVLSANLMRIIEARTKGRTIELEAAEEPKQAEVVDLMERLRRSLAQAGGSKRPTARATHKRASKARSTAKPRKRKAA